MATTKLTDVVVPTTFQKVIESKLTENSKIRQAGVVSTDPRFSISSGFETTVPFWRRPAGGEAQSQGGDETVKGTASKVTQGKMTARVLSRSNAFAALNIADYASDADAIAFASGEFARLRVGDEESAMLAILKGIIAANVANRTAYAAGDLSAPAGTASDMIFSNVRTTGTIDATNRFGSAALLGGRKTMGDRGGDLKLAIMHSDVVNNLRAVEPNAFVPASQTDIGLERYQGYFIVESDNIGIDVTLPSYPVYTTYLMGSELFAYASGIQDHPLEDVRDAAAGSWSGMDTTVNRFRYMLHPYGWMASGVPANSVSLTNPELATATNWTRAVERKAIPLVAVRTNG